MQLIDATHKASAMLETGELKDLAAAQVAIVRMMGVRIIDSPAPRECRTALNAGVKAGELGRLPKQGLLPEAYFHPNAKSHALELRARIANESVAAIAKVVGFNPAMR